jgi:hypothetical protein
MFRWLSPNDYPDARVLVDVLLGASERLNVQGAVCLTAEEVVRLQQAGYVAVLAPGWWSPPRLPLDILRGHPSLARLAAHWYGPHALDLPQPVVSQPASIEVSVADRLRWRVHDALRKTILARVLRSLAGGQDGRSSKRDLQHRLRRLPAAVLNPAIDHLVHVGLIARENGWLTLPVDVREALAAAGVGVRRPRFARAKRRPKAAGRTCGPERTGKSARIPVRLASTQTTAPVRGPDNALRTARPYRPHPVPDRRLHPRAWGRSMAAKRAGLARQRLCRAAGICATDAANAARAAQRAQHERRQTALSESATFSAPVTSSVATGTCFDDWFSADSGRRVAAALQYIRPIGRDARLAAERRRR